MGGLIIFYLYAVLLNFAFSLQNMINVYDLKNKQIKIRYNVYLVVFLKLFDILTEITQTHIDTSYI